MIKEGQNNPSYLDCEPRVNHFVEICYKYNTNICPKTCNYAVDRMQKDKDRPQESKLEFASKYL